MESGSGGLDGGLSADATPPPPARAGLTQAPARAAGPRGGLGAPLCLLHFRLGGFWGTQRERNARTPLLPASDLVSPSKMGTVDSAVARVSPGFSHPQGPGVPLCLPAPHSCRA